MDAAELYSAIGLMVSLLDTEADSMDVAKLYDAAPAPPIAYSASVGLVPVMPATLDRPSVAVLLSSSFTYTPGLTKRVLNPSN